ncbi:MAG: aminopeptidase P family protein [Bacteroidales bacterium]|nr:aminopeptidase P family protein [Bacteroidales bacterium]
MDILLRLENLRRWMTNNHLDAFIVPSTDPHCGEYIPEHWEARKWVSGFTGSAGTIVVTLKEAALWTDSRYFIQATQQLKGTGIQLMKDRMPGTPSIGNWLLSTLQEGCVVGLCGEVFANQEVECLFNEISPCLSIVSTEDPFNILWENRPLIPTNPLYIQPLRFAGKSTKEKLDDIRHEMSLAKVENYLLCALDEIAWVTNLRGNDVHCNPVFVSYLLISQNTATLFINTQKLTEEVRLHLEESGISVADYSKVFNAISKVDSILLDGGTTNHAVFNSLSATCKVKMQKSPVAYMKAIKNQAEIEGFHQAMLRDGIAMVKFLKWLIPAVEKGGETELSVSNKLAQLRAEQPYYIDISFDTIAGYQHHGAIVHYEPTAETDVLLKAEGFLLLDSGAQYLDGTTDITRTIALGPVTSEMKHDYTLILKGFIQLGLAKFPDGASGTQLDILARAALWKDGKNFFHGTGHGVGSHLCVHEGPHQIRMNYMPAPLHAGMTVTDEPGLYLEGKYGIRTENTLLIVPYLETDFGRFLQFEHLTLCPIDTTPIDKKMLTAEEIEWLNNYHQTVYDKISPFLNTEEKTWLANATQPL